jgi:hypothetical protein
VRTALFGPFPDGPAGRRLQRASHSASHGVMAAMGMWAIFGFFRWDNQPGNIIGILFGLIPFTVFVASMYLVLRHNAYLCETCIARFPLNGSELAVRRANNTILRFYHVTGKHSRLCSALVLGYIILGSSFSFRDSWQDGLASLPFLLIVPLLIYAARTHARLQPWCPWCRGNGGDDEPSPGNPPGEDHGMPVPSGSRSA